MRDRRAQPRARCVTAASVIEDRHLQIRVLDPEPSVGSLRSSTTMSSFKRRTPAKQAPTPVGARISPGATPSFITSTGIPSLDDILGGGLPLSCSMLTLAPDVHSAYGELIQKYFISQGLACGQKICIVDEDADAFLAECMWTPSAPAHGVGPSTAPEKEDGDEGKAGEEDAKIKIAWRYEQMKQFQTTVPASNQYVVSSFCVCRATSE